MRKPARILAVEEDPVQQALLRRWLGAEGYQVEIFRNGPEARNHLSDYWTDLLILDWDSPGFSGERFLQWVRGRSGTSVPVIFQMARTDEEKIVRILDAGADDFLTKPLERLVLLARVRAVLRRAHNTTGDKRRVIVGDCLLNQANQTIERGAAADMLGAKEFDLLWHLASHLGTVVQRQDLHSIIWGWDGGLNSRSVDMYVSRLRARLKELGIGWSIQSVYGKGYRLNLTAREPAPTARKPALAGLERFRSDAGAREANPANELVQQASGLPAV
jgi:two-component system, OmpR family, phosphate regulon response regulator PhoB